MKARIYFAVENADSIPGTVELDNWLAQNLPPCVPKIQIRNIWKSGDLTNVLMDIPHEIHRCMDRLEDRYVTLISHDPFWIRCINGVVEYLFC